MALELELAELETHVLELDDRFVQADEDGLMSYDLDTNDESSKQLKKLLAEISQKLKDYGALTLHEQTVHAQ